MGMGDLGKPEMVFVRKFRWTLKGKYLSEMFNKSVGINYYHKHLTIGIIEVYEKGGSDKTHAHAWAELLESGECDEELVFTTFDGCGKELYAKKFSGLKIKNRYNRFDYSDNEEAVHEVSVSYDSCEDVPTTEEVHPTESREVWVDHLNAKMTIK